MKYRLMDLLACPICKTFPLTLYVLSERTVQRSPPDQRRPICELYCGYKRVKTSELTSPPCDECYKQEIVEGVLYCPNCKRWYPIINEIPRMLPDKLRKKEEDLAFLKRVSSRLPKEITEEGLPFNLRS
ncbi:MAG: Trm112 family protein [Thermoprotei archaeon]